MGSVPDLAGHFNVKRVAVIGAGPSGLAAAKYLVAENAFDKIDIFEQQSEVGGVWNYTKNLSEGVQAPQTTAYGPPEQPTWSEDIAAPVFSNAMYDRLNTNIPKGLMGFSDQTFPSESLLFPTRQDVQRYLVQYAQDVKHLITFSTQVCDVRVSDENGQDRWEITSISTFTREETVTEYDAVVVANGHYSVPFIPSVPGIKSFHNAFPSIITHSKFYRSPESFKDKKVIVIGKGPSGHDISSQISHVCRKPLLISVSTPSALNTILEIKEEVPRIAEFLVNERGVRFEDGRVEKDVDAILYCTGYLYSFPFLQTLEPPVVTTGSRVLGLYKQLFNIPHPTLAFTALVQKVIPFVISEGQGAAIAKVWANRLALPQREAMRLSEKKEVEDRGDGKGFHVLGYPKDAVYINDLHDWVATSEYRSGKEPPRWGEKDMWMREIFWDVRERFGQSGMQARDLAELGFDFENRNEMNDY